MKKDVLCEIGGREKTKKDWLKQMSGVNGRAIKTEVDFTGGKEFF